MADPKARVILEAKRRGEGAFRSFRADLNSIAGRATIVGTAAAAALTVVTKRAFENIDALAKTADALTIATDKLAGLQLAAKITGVEQEQLNKALLKQQKTIFDANLGLSTATDALDILGLEVKDLLSLSADEQFAKIAQAMDGIENATIRSGVAASIYGARNVAVLKTLELGEEGLRQYAEQAERTGLAINRIDAAKIEQANDAVTIAKSTLQGLVNVFAVQVAPVVQALATGFTNAAGDAESMGERIQSVISAIVSSVGVVADAFYGWQIIFKTVEVGAIKLGARIEELRALIRGFAGDTAQQAENIRQVFDIQISAASSEQIRKNLEEARDIQLAALDPGVNQDRLDAALAAEAAADAEYRSLLEAGRPSQTIRENFEAAQAAAEATARATAEAAAANLATAGAETGETDEEIRAREAAEAEAAILKERHESELAQLQSFLMTKEEAELAAIQRRKDILQAAFDDALITEDERNQLKAEVERLGQEALTKIAEEGFTEREKFAAKSAQAQAQHVLGALTEMTQGVAQTNRAMFKINQAAALANAVINTAQAVTRALAEYPPPLSFAMAAAQAAAGAAQIQAIKSATFGGGTTPSVAGTGAVINDQPVPNTFNLSTQDSARSAPIVNVYVEGGINGPGGFDEFMDMVQENLTDRFENRDEIIFTERSRQAAV